MRTLLYLDTSGHSDQEVTVFILCLGGMLGERTNIDVSAFEIERQRKREPLFAFHYDGQVMNSGRFWSWQDLAEIGQAGTKVVQVASFRDFVHQVRTTYKYYRYEKQ